MKVKLELSYPHEKRLFGKFLSDAMRETERLQEQEKVEREERYKKQVEAFREMRNRGASTLGVGIDLTDQNAIVSGAAETGEVRAYANQAQHSQADNLMAKEAARVEAQRKEEQQQTIHQPAPPPVSNAHVAEGSAPFDLPAGDEGYSERPPL